MSVAEFPERGEPTCVKVRCVEVFVTSEKRSHIEAIIIRAAVAEPQFHALTFTSWLPGMT